MIKKVLRKELFFIYLASIITVFTVPYFIFIPQKAFLFSVIFTAAYLFLLECFFRILFKIVTKAGYRMIPKVPFKKMHIEPHPYLPYVFKKNFICQRAMPSTAPLNRGKGYVYAQLKTNNFRHLNGPRGDRDIEVPKLKGMIRINCLGASTTASSLFYKGKNSAYPLQMEGILQKHFPDLNIEVNNFGQGGYTTAEILIKFLLTIIDTEPDVIVIYHACNDLRASLTECFESDYSHARKNLGEVYYLYKLASYVPYIPLASWNFMVNHCLFSQNVRYSIPQVVERKEADMSGTFRGLGTYKRNLEHIINVCKANSIHVVLSTYCHYLYPAIRDNEVHLKYREGIKLENQAMKELARKHNMPLVENDRLIPEDTEYFMDSVHFSPHGLTKLAENISVPITEYIEGISKKQ